MSIFNCGLWSQLCSTGKQQIMLIKTPALFTQWTLALQTMIQLMSCVLTWDKEVREYPVKLRVVHLMCKWQFFPLAATITDISGKETGKQLMFFKKKKITAQTVQWWIGGFRLTRTSVSGTFDGILMKLVTDKSDEVKPNYVPCSVLWTIALG